MIQKTSGGYIALIIILVITALSLIVAISLRQLDYQEVKISIANENTSQVSGLAKGCFSEAITRIQEGYSVMEIWPNNDYYTDNINLSKQCNPGYFVGDDHSCPSNDTHCAYVANRNYVEESPDNGCRIVGQSPFNEKYDLYSIPSMSEDLGPIEGISVDFYGGQYCSENNPSQVYAQVFLKLGSNNYERTGKKLMQPPQVPRGTNAWYSNYFEINPRYKRPWQWSDITDLKIGFKLTCNNDSPWGWIWIWEIKAKIFYKNFDIKDASKSDTDLDFENGTCNIKISETYDTSFKDVEVIATSTSAFMVNNINKIQATVDLDDPDNIAFACYGEQEGACFDSFSFHENQ